MHKKLGSCMTGKRVHYPLQQTTSCLSQAQQGSAAAAGACAKRRRVSTSCPHGGRPSLWPCQNCHQVGRLSPPAAGAPKLRRSSSWRRCGARRVSTSCPLRSRPSRLPAAASKSRAMPTTPSAAAPASVQGPLAGAPAAAQSAASASLCATPNSQRDMECAFRDISACAGSLHQACMDAIHRLKRASCWGPILHGRA